MVVNGYFMFPVALSVYRERERERPLLGLESRSDHAGSNITSYSVGPGFDF